MRSQSSNVPLVHCACLFTSTIPRPDDGHILALNVIRQPSDVPKRAPGRASRREKGLSRSMKCPRFLYLDAFKD